MTRNLLTTYRGLNSREASMGNTHEWRFREADRTGIPGHNFLPWMPAQVPGHVHLDLMRAGVISDPFRRMQERDVQWVDDSDWVYETTFTVEEVPAHAYLKFHGIDTVAEISLNGEELGRTDNMLIPHEFPVGGKLKAGVNTLSILFRSALRVGRERQAAWDAGGNVTIPYHWDNWAERSFVRKAQYTSGWDWGPVLRGCGLWQRVELVTVPVARMTDWKYDYEFTGENTVKVTVTADIERTDPDAPLVFDANLRVNIADMPGKFKHEKAQSSVPPGVGIHQVSVTLPEVSIDRWQPNGHPYGPRVYSLNLVIADPETLKTVVSEETACDWKMVKVGFRTVELLHEPDADGKGEGFKFRVNGVDIFIKGANWIPDHSFPATISRKQLEQRIRQAKNAGFNMLRIWGGGLYESEDFYEICDSQGILVWQDFAYGCAYYPDTGEYARQARIEATTAVKRIRNHPSLALWCGNNENLTMFEGNWTKTRPARFLGENLYNDILPAVVAAEDAKTPYWPGSPYGGDNANSADFGDCHNWDVWHGRGDWVHYVENDSRFCSEFGFAASCGLGAWDTVLNPEDRSPNSPVVRWHDKTRKGYETYLNYIAIHFPESQSLEDLVYYSQINQAEAMKCGVEHYRRRKGRCWGTLIWQLNDCWPVQSWAMIDSLGEPKASYYASKRFYAPVLVSLVRDGDTITAHLVNDTLEPFAGTLELGVETFAGEQVVQTRLEVTAPANAAAVVGTLNIAAAQGREREVVVYARFTADGNTVATNTLFLAEPKDLALPTPGLSVVVGDHRNPHELSITVTATRFAPYVWLRRTDNAPLGNLGDNFFHLRAGESVTLSVVKPDSLTADSLRGQLIARTL